MAWSGDVKVAALASNLLSFVHRTMQKIFLLILWFMTCLFRGLWYYMRGWIFAMPVVFLLSFPSLSAQRVRHINVDNGLCTNSLTDLTLDHHGNMWIGSYSGLMKFSGTHIKCITKVGTGPHAISGPEMHSVTEDQCGFIWIGTTAGLNKIDPVTFEVIQYPIRSPFKGSSSVGYIYAVYADRYDFIWFSTDIALFRLDINTGLYEVIPTNKDEHSVPHHSVSYNGFLEDEGGLWISTGLGMTYYDYQKRQFFHKYNNPEQKGIFMNNRKSADFHSDLEKDGNGKIWLIWEQEQLASYDPTSGQLDTFRFELPEGTWRCCWSIGVDARENIWMGTRHGGVMVFNTTSKTFTSLKDDGINRMIQSDYIYSIERGPQGQMFVAHDNGLDIIDLYDLTLNKSKLNSRIDFLNLKHQSGDITFNETEQSVYIPFYSLGFFRYDLDDDSITLFEDNFVDERSTPLIYALNGKEYISSAGNLKEIEINKNSLDVLGNNLLPDTLSDTRGHIIWCYVESPESIYVRKSSGRIFHIHEDEIKVMSGYGFKANICLSPDSQVISYVTPELNLVRMQLLTRKDDTIDIQHHLERTDFSFSNPRHIVDDGRSVWMTGQNGILRFDYIDDQLHTYGVEQGLSHSFTFSVVLDLQRNVWVGSIGGVDRYDKAEDRFVSVHTIKDNTYMDAFGHAICSRKGELVFHFGNKIVLLRPELEQVKTPEPLRVHLNEVLVNGYNIDWQTGQRLNQLSHLENRLTFVYDMLIYDESDIVSFYYRLNGREWIENGKRNEINLDGLASGRYLLEVRGSVGSKTNLTDSLSIPFHIRQPWWKEWWFLALLFILVIASIWKYFKDRIEKFRKELLVARQIMDLESKALRVQMNPHFVFNSLNAIQECIVTGKVDEAYTYLSKFSKLLRMVLEHSDVSSVSLQEEMEVLNLYISLEKLRFKDDMVCDFYLDKELDAEEIYLSPMLIQPHLENAIWHGLRHKEGHKYLSLSISEKETGYLDVIIEDNGIGRKKAGEIGQNRLGGSNHKSKGKQLSENRMELLRNSYTKTSMVIKDLYSENGDAAGTKIFLTIPMLEKNTNSPGKQNV